MAKFIDFDSIIKTDWTKPSVQKNPLWIIAALGAMISVGALFVKWIILKTTVTVNGNEVWHSNLSSAPFENTEAIFIVIGLVLAIYGLLYRQYGVATLAGLIVFGFGCAYMFDAINETATIVQDGKSFTLKELGDGLKYQISQGAFGPSKYVNHFTTINGCGFLFAVAGGFLTALCSFLLYKKSNK